MIYHQNAVACFVVCQIPCHGKNCPKRWGGFLKKRGTPFIGRLVLVVIGLSTNHYPSAWYWLFVVTLHTSWFASHNNSTIYDQCPKSVNKGSGHTDHSFVFLVSGWVPLILLSVIMHRYLPSLLGYLCTSMHPKLLFYGFKLMH